MEKLIIKIGADHMKELKAVFDHPEKAEKNVHTLFLDSSEDLYRLLSPQRLELLRRLIKHQAERKTIGELAKELGISSKQALEALHALNIEAKSHSSSISDEAIKRVKTALSVKKPAAPKASAPTPPPFPGQPGRPPPPRRSCRRSFLR